MTASPPMATPPNDPSRPESFERRVLLAVTGLSPQIVTETLYGLCFPRTGAAFVPTEIHVLTTSVGAAKVAQSLLDPDTGHFHRLLNDYGLSGIDFDHDKVIILRDVDGQFMDDIRTPGDNERAADAIMEWIRQFATDRRCALHVSLAGGRKTMGFFAGYALSLFGRVQDRLSHVLVSSPFEQMPDFFYPPPTPRIMQTADGVNRLSSAAAHIDLAPIPFVRLLEDLPESMLKGKTSFSSAVQAAQGRLGPLLLEFDVPGRGLRCGSREIRMPPQLYAFYLWHARRAIEMGDAALLSWKDVSDPERDALLANYLEVLDWDNASADYKAAQQALRDGLDKDSWAVRISDIHDLLNNALGRSGAEPYLFTQTRVPGAGRMLRRGLRNLPADRIVIRSAKRPQPLKGIEH